MKKFNTTVLILIVFLLIVGLNFAVSSCNDTSHTSDSGPVHIFDDDVSTPEPDPGTDTESDSLEEKIVSMLSDYQTTLETDGYSPDDVVDALISAINNHPEFFWLDGSYSYSASSKSDDAHVVVTLGLIVNESDIPAMSQQLQQLVSSIVSKTNSGMSDYDKALFAHDYITANCYYDHDLYNSASKAGDDATYFGRYGYSAYGCLVEGKAVCAGYSKAFQLLMNEMDIPCFYVTGTADNGEGGGFESHAWNYIVLGGENYYVDVTWDDPSSTDSSSTSDPNHNYFCVTGDELYKSHKPDDGQNVPDSFGRKYNYHIYNNLYLETYDFSALSALIDVNGVSEIKFSSEAELQRACADLFDNSRIFDIPALSSASFNTAWHSTCEECCVLSVWIT